MRILRNIPALLLAFSLLNLLACSKDDSSGMARIQVRLTDDPADYDEVNIDVRDVQVNPDNDDEGWISLEGVQPDIYNLLELTNGIDAILADSELPAGRLTQLRLILGGNNTVVIGNRTEDLKTPSGQQSGLKVNIQENLEEGVTYTILLDFDAAKSVVEAGNSGQFLLKPVIRAITEAASGSIRGTLLPAGVQAVISAENGNDSYSTFADENGRFLIRGLPPGTYTVRIEPDSESGLMEKTFMDVEVVLGEVTDLGTIDLEH